MIPTNKTSTIGIYSVYIPRRTAQPTLGRTDCKADGDSECLAVCSVRRPVRPPVGTPPLRGCPTVGRTDTHADDYSYHWILRLEEFGLEYHSKLYAILVKKGEAK